MPFSRPTGSVRLRRVLSTTLDSRMKAKSAKLAEIRSLQMCCKVMGKEAKQAKIFAEKERKLVSDQLQELQASASGSGHNPRVTWLRFWQDASRVGSSQPSLYGIRRPRLL